MNNLGNTNNPTLLSSARGASVQMPRTGELERFMEGIGNLLVSLDPAEVSEILQSGKIGKDLNKTLIRSLNGNWGLLMVWQHEDGLRGAATKSVLRSLMSLEQACEPEMRPEVRIHEACRTLRENMQVLYLILK